MSTPLDAYLRRESVNEADFAARIGRDRSMVNKLRRGVIKPTLELAATIEIETSGEVTMGSWVAPADQPATEAA